MREVDAENAFVELGLEIAKAIRAAGTIHVSATVRTPRKHRPLATVPLNPRVVQTSSPIRFPSLISFPFVPYPLKGWYRRAQKTLSKEEATKAVPPPISSLRLLRRRRHSSSGRLFCSSLLSRCMSKRPPKSRSSQERGNLLLKNNRRAS